MNLNQRTSASLIFELHAATEKIAAMEREVELLKKQVADWKEIATTGMPELMQRWIESEIVRGRKDELRRMKKLGLTR